MGSGTWLLRNSSPIVTARKARSSLAFPSPVPPSPDAFRYRKVSRVKPKGASVLSIAVHIAEHERKDLQRPNRLWRHGADAIRAKAAERALEGRTLDEAGIAAAVAAAAEGTAPMTDPIASAWYRREVVGVHLARVLLGREGLRKNGEDTASVHA